jgi:predicted nucleic-acid-binding protein
MSTLRKKKMDDVLRILREKRGQAKFKDVFSLMFEKYSLTKKTFWDYLDALKTSGKIDYPAYIIFGHEDELLIKLLEKKE